jgi:hypothetical protein
VLLAFENGDPARPIVMGVLRSSEPRVPAFAVDADSERMVVAARGELVLRCGRRASRSRVQERFSSDGHLRAESFLWRQQDQGRFDPAELSAWI